VWVYSRDRRRWEAGSGGGGGAKRLAAVSDSKSQMLFGSWLRSTTWGVWYEYRVGVWVNQYDVFCGVVVNGVRLDQPQCRTVEDCARQILEDYRREVEKMREPPPPPPPDLAEELLKEYPELQAFGVEWVRKWAILKERLVEIAKVLHRFPWMVEVVKQRPMSILHPYIVEVYVAKDGSDARLSPNPPKAYCAQNGSVREVRLELEFKRYETYEDKIREVYRPKGLLAFTATAKEYVRIL
jgi:hypothetical protein